MIAAAKEEEKQDSWSQAGQGRLRLVPGYLLPGG